MKDGESDSEELASTITHGIGVILSVGALVLMLIRAVPHGIWPIVGVSVFGICLVLLYLSSTIYHAVTSHEWKSLWQIIDHCFIFVLIAGSYMPWVLVNLRGPWGWWIFGIIWSLAIAGIVLKTLYMPRFRNLGLAIYILMGWLICIAAGPLMQHVNTEGLIWLTAGGLAYTAGVYFYLQEKLKFAHAIWHGFVLAGSACHVTAVLVAVIPDTASSISKINSLLPPISG